MTMFAYQVLDYYVKYNERTALSELTRQGQAGCSQVVEATSWRYLLLTSGPFGDSMSAAARPKRWGVFRQAIGREFDPSRVELFTLLT
jgi:hypothetical protein